ncbi:MAG: hypothetical protein K2O73_01890 [Lachnospiraceae bacterium]|nr:hypothetical protein [Lachnospiraceae bacterium]MDE7435743.1 hypothetical protein [Lachnospiraceae bacterium]
MRVGMIGNENRTPYIKAYLERSGAEVISIEHNNLDQIGACKALVFPVPVLESNGCIKGCREDMTASQVLGRVRRGCVLYGGNFPDEWRFYARRQGIILRDFLQMEEVREQNGAMTAQGCLMEAIQESRASAAGRRCLVIGYGCCGRHMARILQGAGACVRVWDTDRTRREQASKNGFETVQSIEAQNGESEWIPEWIFHMADRRTMDYGSLQRCAKETLIVDITTGGGCDMAAAEKLGVHVLSCPGLPGKWMPRSGGDLFGGIIVAGGVRV